MTKLQDIVAAVENGFAPQEYQKGPHATGEGDRYEERVLALVFLRCLSSDLIFQLSANNRDADKFNDVVLGWRTKEDTKANTLLVQLKHKISPQYMTINSDQWLSEVPNSDFWLNKYCASYVKVRESQEMDRMTFVLMTNASLDDSSIDMFVDQKGKSFPGLELLQAGGDLYRLNMDNERVQKAVSGNTSFVEHFYLLCKQRNYDKIMGDICEELIKLLGASNLCTSICKDLCSDIRDWMNKQSVCLTSCWSKWQALVDEYVKKELTGYKLVTTRLVYHNVEDVWVYVRSRNPAWVRPPERATEALSATKIHRALADEIHIMVGVERFTELQEQILCCWGRLCRWLVIVDDDRENNSGILSELVTHVKNERRLVIVSWRGINGINGFPDKCNASDVSNYSWNECLDVSVRLNGDLYECHLRDLVAGVHDLKSLLGGEPALLLALARLSQPLRMGRDLETLPAHYVPREMVDQRLLADEFFSTLGRVWGCERKQEKVQLEATDATASAVIVVGRPGVGKSKMLSHVAKKIKERVPESWLLRINLSEYYTVLDSNQSAEAAMKDILMGTVFNEGELGRLEYALLRHSLLQSRRFVCLVDGFDEVCPDYVDKCLQVLPLLAPGKGKLLVTTRPEPLELLQSQIGAQAYSLGPFSKSELEDFFRRHPSREKIRRIRGLNKSLRGLLRIPLFAEMFANLTQETAETYDIVTLYEAFFRNHFRRLYEEKWGDNLSAPGKKEAVKDVQERHEEQLMLLAVSVLLRGKHVPAKLSIDTDFLVKAGIVYMVGDGKCAFLHRTFAEHFLAKWCFLGDGRRDRATVYRKAYVKDRLDFFLESFNRMAVRGRQLLEAVLDGDEEKAGALLAQGADPRQTDAFGRNVLHLAAAKSVVAHEERFSLPLLQPQCRDDAWQTMLSTEDGLLGWAPMRYAAEGRRWLIVHELLKAGGDLAQLGDFQAGAHDPVKLQAVFERDGYRALYQHVIEVKHPLRNGNHIEMMEEQIEFAVSLISAKMPRECLKLISDEAFEKEHMMVCYILGFRTTGEDILFGMERERSLSRSISITSLTSSISNSRCSLS